MFNPQNLQALSDELENTLETLVSIKLLNKLSNKQRNYLAVLINLWSIGKKTNDGKEPVDVIKSILDSAKEKINHRTLSPQRELYKSIKKYE